jgi:hypothetical protein
MRRYHEEKHIIARRLKENSAAFCFDAPHPSRFRKTHIGCNRAACQLCHPGKFPKRIPTRKEKQAKYDERAYD